MIVVRIVSVLLCAFLALAAYMTPDDSLIPLIGSVFFGSMAFLSVRNAGAIDGPFVYFAIGAVALAYSFIGASTGQYTWRRYLVSVQENPQIFWAVFAGTFLFAVGAFVYGYFHLKKQRRA